MHAKSFAKVLTAIVSLCVFSLSVSAATGVVVQDNFTGNSTQNTWRAINAVCLTAKSSGDKCPSGSTACIPGCGTVDNYANQQYYIKNNANPNPLISQVGGYASAPYSTTQLDVAGNGALRLTNAAGNESGAIIIDPSQAFPLSAGIQVTFTTITYDGDSQGDNSNGADGISFFLMDAKQAPNLGAFGGSLGYSCSDTNIPYDGMWGAYIGLGIDEYGNFLNGGATTGNDNTHTGIPAATGTNYPPFNSSYPNRQGGRIGLRGAGSVSWAALTAAYGTNPGNPSLPYYPPGLTTTCATNGTWDPTANGGKGACETAICSGNTGFNVDNGDCETGSCPQPTLFSPANSNCETPQCTTGEYYQWTAGNNSWGTGACQTPHCSSSQYYQGGANACQTPTCPASKYYNSAASGCAVPTCPSGQFYDSAANQCATPTCASSTQYYQGGTVNACETPVCTSGKYYQGGSANACQTPTCGSGTFYESAVNACSVPTCAAGQYYQGGTVNACETPTCTSGKYYQAGTNYCQTPKCSPSGTYQASSNTCSTGTLSWSGTTAPTWSSSGATQPTSWSSSTVAVSSWSGTTAPTWSSSGATQPTNWSNFTAPTGWGTATAVTSWGNNTPPTSWTGNDAPTFNGTPITNTPVTYGGTPTGQLSYGAALSGTPYSQLAVKNTCLTGNLFNYGNPSSPTSAGPALTTNANNTAGILDYAAVPGAYSILTTDHKIAVENKNGGTTRGNATPITYKLKITQQGLLSMSYSYNGGIWSPVITNQDITAANGPLPSSLLFGFAGSTGGSTNIHEISCFKAEPADQTASSASLNIQETAKITTTTQVYLAYYNSTYWSGQLTSQYLVYDPNTQIVSANPIANWDASCVLTGGVCNSMSTPSSSVSITAEPPSSRTILSWSGTQGIPFEWGANPGVNGITTAQQNILDQGDATPLNANRLNFLRGDRSNEITTSGSGLFRARNSVLGDIIHSSPSWVGPVVGAYNSTWTDALNSSVAAPENASTAQTYAQFLTAEATRLNVVYVGANDGMVHGFRSGSYDTSTPPQFVNNSTTPNDGWEVLAYMPGAVLNTIHNAGSTNTIDPTLDYANTQYAHNFYVDATPARGDLFYGGAWHTWLVGGLASGGSAIYALDITNPANFSEANAKSLVIGEWTTAMTCAGNSTCGSNNLGNTYGTPAIRRLHNGKWAVIFGNGSQSKSGSAGIFIMTVDPTSGSTTSYYVDTGYGPSKDPLNKSNLNGIYYISPVDLDGDNIVDYVYAGDLFGNIWRFDLTSSDPTQWAAASAPLFSTPAGQPITSQVLPVILAPQNGSAQRMLIEFGTGQEIPQTTTNAAIDSSTQQAIYGVWDWNMTAWNSVSPANQFATLSNATAPTGTLAISKLQQQTITSSGNISITGVSATTALTETSYPVCWQGSSYCATGDNQYGWYLNLAPSTTTAGYEEVIYSPALIAGSLVMNSTIPPTNSPALCTTNSATGFTYGLDPSTGGPAQSFFLTPDGKAITYNGSSIGALGAGAVGTAYGVTLGIGSNNASGMVLNSPNGMIFQRTGGSKYRGSRITWTQKR